MQNFPSCLKRDVPRRPPPSLPRWPEGGHLCQLHVLPVCKTPLLLSHALLSLCALLTMRVVAHRIARPFRDHVKERTQKISLLNRTAGFKDTKLLKTKTTGWGTMEAGWKVTLHKGSSMLILFYNQDIKKASVLSPGHLYQGRYGCTSQPLMKI